jgi:hypothetical protein
MSKSEKRLRTVALAVRLTPEEAEAIKTKAMDSGVPVSEFLRAAAIGRKTRSTLDSQVINELRRLGGLQKHLFTESGGKHSSAYAGVLLEIRNAVARISNDGS